MKNIDYEIANLTKLTVSKITNLDLTNSDIDKAIKSSKESLN